VYLRNVNHGKYLLPPTVLIDHNHFGLCNSM
jgi:hypothetical protein